MDSLGCAASSLRRMRGVAIDSSAGNFCPADDPVERKCVPARLLGALWVELNVSHETHDMLEITQEVYDAKMRYAKTTHKMDILMRSLSTWNQGRL